MTGRAKPGGPPPPFDLTAPITPAVAQAIDHLALPKDRPLIISDADEVLFLFLAGLESLMADEGLYLDLQSFRLTGSIKRKDTDLPLEQADVTAFISRFFMTAMDRLVPVEGASRALAELAGDASIVVLTNTPAAAHGARAAALARHGMNYPVIANEGLKGPAVARLVAGRRAPTVFIDDLPPNHDSVSRHAPEVLRIQMIGDRRLAALATPTPHAHHRADDWGTAQTLIRTHFRGC